MKPIDQIINKYSSLFEKSMEYLDILKECHEKINDFKNFTFTLENFRNESDYRVNISIIEEFRKYVELDEFILENDSTSTSLVLATNDFTKKITYHDVMSAIQLYNDNFFQLKQFYIKRNFKNITNELDMFKVLTINDIFTNDSNLKFKLYFIESNKKYCFGVIEDGFEYLYYLPFENINLKSDNNSIIYGYLYLIQEYVSKKHNSIEKTIKYTTLYQEYGVLYNDFLKNPIYNGTYKFYLENLKPFLIEVEGLTYYHHLENIRFDVIDIHLDKEEQHKDFYIYFQTLELDESKVMEYVENNWIRRTDIGRNYPIQYNMCESKEEIIAYKENIVKEKFNHIKLNFLMYKKYGLIKFAQDKVSVIPKDGYKPYLLKYFKNFVTDKESFNSIEDKRINLENGIFRIGHSDGIPFDYYKFEFKHINGFISEDHVFTNDKDSSRRIKIQVDLVNFIRSYNSLFNTEELVIDYNWYFPMKQLNHYIDSSVQKFSLLSDTGCLPYDFEFLKDAVFYEGKELLNTLTHPNLRSDQGGKKVLNRNPFYFDTPIILYLNIDKSEFELIKKGKHTFFKHPFIENLIEDKKLALEAGPRFRSKSDIIKNNDFEVAYNLKTSFNVRERMHQGTKGKIISIDNEIIIEDEFGKIHKESFQTIARSGWKHLNTFNYEEFYNNLNVGDKAFFEKNRHPNKLLDNTNIKPLSLN